MDCGQKEVLFSFTCFISAEDGRSISFSLNNSGVISSLLNCLHLSVKCAKSSGTLWRTYHSKSCQSRPLTLFFHARYSNILNNKRNTTSFSVQLLAIFLFPLSNIRFYFALSIFERSGAISTPKCTTFDIQTAQLRCPNGPFRSLKRPFKNIYLTLS